MDSEVLDSYGGEFPDANSISAIDPTDKRSRSTNAYMLIYIRESSINEILSPVIPEDIPDHLRMYILIYLN
jgi:ubiquitin carboxyl-terminal hydrolase 7